MKIKLLGAIRWFFVIIGIIVLTSFTIDATDTLTGSNSALSLFALRVTEGECPAGMSKVSLAEKSLCIDQYENSFDSVCPHHVPVSVVQTQQNVNYSGCETVSVADEVPAVFTSFHQAQHFCALRGGRLPTGHEWHEAALGTPDTESCNSNGSRAATGAFADCQSARGMYDMIGNVWEWIDDPVQNGQLADRALPSTGYVAAADRAGVATQTDTQPSEQFNHDYFWSEPAGDMVVMRGGFYNSESDGGIYAVHADMDPSFSGAAIGFRCVVDL